VAGVCPDKLVVERAAENGSQQRVCVRSERRCAPAHPRVPLPYGRRRDRGQREGAEVGDVQMSLVRISCHCGAPVAVLWSNDRRARTGEPAFLFLQAQIIEDQATRPVRTRIVEDVVKPGKSFPADCPAHGRHIIDGASLIEHGRAMQARIARGGEQMAARIARGEERSGKYILPRVSRPPE